MRSHFLGGVVLWVALPLGVASSQLPSPLDVGADRALIVSPHPDDATLAAGGLMQRIVQKGGSVQVIQMTGGDAFTKGVVALTPHLHPNPALYRWYGSVREREALRALSRLGIGRSQIRLLGYPDDGLCLLARTGEPFISPYTARESPPPSEQLIPGAMYLRDDLVRELSDLIIVLRPTLIVLPHCGDLHPDHCATHLLVHRALSEAAAVGVRVPRLLHYVLHYPDWPRGETDAPLTPPAVGPASDWRWSTLALTNTERATKTRALDAYRSQRLAIPTFMKAFERANELFIEADESSPVPCWCNGENIATMAIAER